MAQEIAATAVPLHVDDGGTIRVGGTRVTLESVVASYRCGATAETIVERFPSLTLQAVYGALHYYLAHGSEVEEYLAKQKSKAEAVQREVEARWGSQDGLRERLLLRAAMQNRGA